MARSKILVAVICLLTLVMTTQLAYGAFNDEISIWSGTGTRISAASIASVGGSLLYSSYPEYVTGDGRLFDTTRSVTRFRTYLYHVNQTSVSRYIGFAIKNTGTSNANLYVSKRGFVDGDPNFASQVGRDAQANWYASSTTETLIATIPPNGWWYSTDPANPALTFKTTTLAANRLHEGIWDLRLSNASGAAVPIRFVTFSSYNVQRPLIEPMALHPRDANTDGSNFYCPKNTLNVTVNMNFGGQDRNFQYYDLYRKLTATPEQDPGEQICMTNNRVAAPGAYMEGNPGAWGNYGVDYNITFNFSNPGPSPLRWVVNNPNSYCAGLNQYFAGVVTQGGSASNRTTAEFAHDYPSAGWDKSRELGGGIYTTANIRTMLTGGNCAPLRLYVYGG